MYSRFNHSFRGRTKPSLIPVSQYKSKTFSPFQLSTEQYPDFSWSGRYLRVFSSCWTLCALTAIVKMTRVQTDVLLSSCVSFIMTKAKWHMNSVCGRIIKRQKSPLSPGSSCVITTWDEAAAGAFRFLHTWAEGSLLPVWLPQHTNLSCSYSKPLLL